MFLPPSLTARMLLKESQPSRAGDAETSIVRVVRDLSRSKKSPLFMIFLERNDVVIENITTFAL